MKEPKPKPAKPLDPAVARLIYRQTVLEQRLDDLTLIIAAGFVFAVVMLFAGDM